MAIVGSGPAAMYAADELLTQHGVRVNVFEKLPTPYGLVRAGVAPDHQTTKRVTELFDRIARRREFRFFLNVEIGKHLSHDDLLAHHHAVIYAVGAPNDRRLDIDGMDLPGTGTATELVAWINGHPDFTDLPVDLSHERVIVVGNGNVAIDVARVLTADPDELARTDISDHALKALRASRVREVVIAARRGPAHSAFTLPELIGLTTTAEVVLAAADHEAVLRDLATVSDTVDEAEAGDPVQARRRVDAADAAADPAGLPPDAHSAFWGSSEPAGWSSRSPAPTRCSTLEAGLVLSSIGYHGKAIQDLPFDDMRGRGAQRRRPRGRLGLGPAGARRLRGGLDQARADGVHRHQQVVRAANGSAAGRRFQRRTLRDPIGKPSALDKLVRERQPDVVDAAGWRAIDAAEVARGELSDRPRNKFTSITDMLDVAAAAPAPPLRRRLADRLRELGRPGLTRLLADRRRDLVHADLAHGLAQRPVMTERIGNHAVAVAPELVLERRDHAGAGVERPLRTWRRRRSRSDGW